MFHIAVLNKQEDSEKDTYMSVLENNDCAVHFLAFEENHSNVIKMDGVIIVEDSPDEIGKTCEAILAIRNQTINFIWIITRQATKMSRMIYLQLGADGIFNEDIEEKEFGLYISNALKRNHLSLTAKERELREVDEISFRLIPDNSSVKISGRGEIGLTRLEYKILTMLVQNEGHVMTYEELYQETWQNEVENDVKKYRIANLVFNLRKKLGEDTLSCLTIRTVRSKGYMIAGE